MALSSEYPQTKPDHSVEVTQPMTKLVLDVATGITTVTFGEGETIDVDLAQDRLLALSGFALLDAVAAHLARDHKVWCDPEIVNRQLAEHEAKLVATRGEKAPF